MPGRRAAARSLDCHLGPPENGSGSINRGNSRHTAVVSSARWVLHVDLDQFIAAVTEVATLARRVAADVVADGRPAVRVGVKVRFVPFLTRTHSPTLDAPTSDAAHLEAAAPEVLERFDRDRPVRLLGVRAKFSE
ncbi:hypothetical protein HF526_09270 [Pseudonocardia sp. K10HN5]|uniref:DNA polymerase Y-family little finger domain-containing protein n=1 Tax=Pseudonocardia acidicola TaxID=2724939 RepID=A0ABX1S9A7_9PSEU|nr:hypothetical protein [Pseudonocardia acidicola]